MWLLAQRLLYCYLALTLLQFIGVPFAYAALIVTAAIVAGFMLLRAVASALSFRDRYEPAVGPFGAFVTVYVRPPAIPLYSTSGGGGGGGGAAGAAAAGAAVASASAASGIGIHFLKREGNQLMTVSIVAPTVTVHVLSAREAAALPQPHKAVFDEFTQKQTRGLASPAPAPTARAPAAASASTPGVSPPAGVESYRVRVARWFLRSALSRIAIRITKATFVVHAPAALDAAAKVPLPVLCVTGGGLTLSFGLGSRADVSAQLLDAASPVAASNIDPQSPPPATADTPTIDSVIDITAKFDPLTVAIPALDSSLAVGGGGGGAVAADAIVPRSFPPPPAAPALNALSHIAALPAITVRANIAILQLAALLEPPRGVSPQAPTQAGAAVGPVRVMAVSAHVESPGVRLRIPVTELSRFQRIVSAISPPPQSQAPARKSGITTIHVQPNSSLPPSPDALITSLRSALAALDALPPTIDVRLSTIRVAMYVPPPAASPAAPPHELAYSIGETAFKWKRKTFALASSLQASPDIAAGSGGGDIKLDSGVPLGGAPLATPLPARTPIMLLPVPVMASGFDISLQFTQIQVISTTPPPTYGASQPALKAASANPMASPNRSPPAAANLTIGGGVGSGTAAPMDEHRFVSVPALTFTTTLFPSTLLPPPAVDHHSQSATATGTSLLAVQQQQQMQTADRWSKWTRDWNGNADTPSGAATPVAGGVANFDVPAVAGMSARSALNIDIPSCYVTATPALSFWIDTCAGCAAHLMPAAAATPIASPAPTPVPSTAVVSTHSAVVASRWLDAAPLFDVSVRMRQFEVQCVSYHRTVTLFQILTDDVELLVECQPPHITLQPLPTLAPAAAYSPHSAGGNSSARSNLSFPVPSTPHSSSSSLPAPLAPALFIGNDNSAPPITTTHPVPAGGAAAAAVAVSRCTFIGSPQRMLSISCSHIHVNCLPNFKPQPIAGTPQAQPQQAVAGGSDFKSPVPSTSPSPVPTSTRSRIGISPRLSIHPSSSVHPSAAVSAESSIAYAYGGGAPDWLFASLSAGRSTRLLAIEQPRLNITIGVTHSQRALAPVLPPKPPKPPRPSASATASASNAKQPDASHKVPATPTRPNASAAPPPSPGGPMQRSVPPRPLAPPQLWVPETDVELDGSLQAASIGAHIGLTHVGAAVQYAIIEFVLGTKSSAPASASPAAEVGAGSSVLRTIVANSTRRSTASKPCTKPAEAATAPQQSHSSGLDSKQHSSPVPSSSLLAASIGSSQPKWRMHIECAVLEKSTLVLCCCSLPVPTAAPTHATASLADTARLNAFIAASQALTALGAGSDGIERSVSATIGRIAVEYPHVPLPSSPGGVGAGVAVLASPAFPAIAAASPLQSRFGRQRSVSASMKHQPASTPASPPPATPRRAFLPPSVQTSFAAPNISVLPPSIPLASSHAPAPAAASELVSCSISQCVIALTRRGGSAGAADMPEGADVTTELVSIGRIDIVRTIASHTGASPAISIGSTTSPRGVPPTLFTQSSWSATTSAPAASAAAPAPTVPPSPKPVRSGGGGSSGGASASSGSAAIPPSPVAAMMSAALAAHQHTSPIGRPHQTTVTVDTVNLVWSLRWHAFLFVVEHSVSTQIEELNNLRHTIKHAQRAFNRSQPAASAKHKPSHSAEPPTPVAVPVVPAVEESQPGASPPQLPPILLSSISIDEKEPLGGGPAGASAFTSPRTAAASALPPPDSFSVLIGEFTVDASFTDYQPVTSSQQQPSTPGRRSPALRAASVAVNAAFSALDAHLPPHLQFGGGAASAAGNNRVVFEPATCILSLHSRSTVITNRLPLVAAPAAAGSAPPPAAPSPPNPSASTASAPASAAASPITYIQFGGGHMRLMQLPTASSIAAAGGAPNSSNSAASSASAAPASASSAAASDRSPPLLAWTGLSVRHSLSRHLTGDDPFDPLAQLRNIALEFDTVTTTFADGFLFGDTVDELLVRWRAFKVWRRNVQQQSLIANTQRKRCMRLRRGGIQAAAANRSPAPAASSIPPAAAGPVPPPPIRVSARKPARRRPPAPAKQPGASDCNKFGSDDEKGSDSDSDSDSEDGAITEEEAEEHNDTGSGDDADGGDVEEDESDDEVDDLFTIDSIQNQLRKSGGGSSRRRHSQIPLRVGPVGFDLFNFDVSAHRFRLMFMEDINARLRDEAAAAAAAATLAGRGDTPSSMSSHGSYPQQPSASAMLFINANSDQSRYGGSKSSVGSTYTGGRHSFTRESSDRNASGGHGPPQHHRGRGATIDEKHRASIANMAAAAESASPLLLVEVDCFAIRLHASDDLMRYRTLYRAVRRLDSCSNPPYPARPLRPSAQRKRNNAAAGAVPITPTPTSVPVSATNSNAERAGGGAASPNFDKSDCDFAELWGRMLTLSGTHVLIRLRDFPIPVLKSAVFELSGLLVAAQLKCPQSWLERTVVRISPLRPVIVERTTAVQLKIYHDWQLKLETGEWCYGVCMLPAISTLSDAVTRLTRTEDVQTLAQSGGALKWWDSMRYKFHGNLQITAVPMTIRVLASVSPNDVSCVHMFATHFELRTWKHNISMYGKHTRATVVIDDSQTSKWGDCKGQFWAVPDWRIGFKLRWTCKHGTSDTAHYVHHMSRPAAPAGGSVAGGQTAPNSVRHLPRAGSLGVLDSKFDPVSPLSPGSGSSDSSTHHTNTRSPLPLTYDALEYFRAVSLAIDIKQVLQPDDEQTLRSQSIFVSGASAAGGADAAAGTTVLVDAASVAAPVTVYPPQQQLDGSSPPVRRGGPGHQRKSSQVSHSSYRGTAAIDGISGSASVVTADTSAAPAAHATPARQHRRDLSISAFAPASPPEVVAPAGLPAGANHLTIPNPLAPLAVPSPSNGVANSAPASAAPTPSGPAPSPNTASHASSHSHGASRKSGSDVSGGQVYLTLRWPCLEWLDQMAKLYASPPAYLKPRKTKRLAAATNEQRRQASMSSHSLSAAVAAAAAVDLTASLSDSQQLQLQNADDLDDELGSLIEMFSLSSTCRKPRIELLHYHQTGTEASAPTSYPHAYYDPHAAGAGGAERGTLLGVWLGAEMWGFDAEFYAERQVVASSDSVSEPPIATSAASAAAWAHAHTQRVFVARSMASDCLVVNAKMLVPNTDPDHSHHHHHNHRAAAVAAAAVGASKLRAVNEDRRASISGAGGFGGLFLFDERSTSSAASNQASARSGDPLSAFGGKSTYVSPFEQPMRGRKGGFIASASLLSICSSTHSSGRRQSFSGPSGGAGGGSASVSGVRMASIDRSSSIGYDHKHRAGAGTGANSESVPGSPLPSYAGLSSLPPPPFPMTIRLPSDSSDSWEHLFSSVESTPVVRSRRKVRSSNVPRADQPHRGNVRRRAGASATTDSATSTPARLNPSLRAGLASLTPGSMLRALDPTASPASSTHHHHHHHRAVKQSASAESGLTIGMFKRSGSSVSSNSGSEVPTPSHLLSPDSHSGIPTEPVSSKPASADTTPVIGPNAAAVVITDGTAADDAATRGRTSSVNSLIGQLAGSGDGANAQAKAPDSAPPLQQPATSGAGAASDSSNDTTAARLIRWQTARLSVARQLAQSLTVSPITVASLLRQNDVFDSAPVSAGATPFHSRPAVESDDDDGDDASGAEGSSDSSESPFFTPRAAVNVKPSANESSVPPTPQSQQPGATPMHRAMSTAPVQQPSAGAHRLMVWDMRLLWSDPIALAVSQWSEVNSQAKAAAANAVPASTRSGGEHASTPPRDANAAAGSPASPSSPTTPPALVTSASNASALAARDDLVVSSSLRPSMFDNINTESVAATPSLASVPASKFRGKKPDEPPTTHSGSAPAASSGTQPASTSSNTTAVVSANTTAVSGLPPPRPPRPARPPRPVGLVAIPHAAVAAAHSGASAPPPQATAAPPADELSGASSDMLKLLQYVDEHGTIVGDTKTAAPNASGSGSRPAPPATPAPHPTVNSTIVVGGGAPESPQIEGKPYSGSVPPTAMSLPPAIRLHPPSTSAANTTASAPLVAGVNATITSDDVLSPLSVPPSPAVNARTPIGIAGAAGGPVPPLLGGGGALAYHEPVKRLWVLDFLRPQVNFQSDATNSRMVLTASRARLERLGFPCLHELQAINFSPATAAAAEAESKTEQQQKRRRRSSAATRPVPESQRVHDTFLRELFFKLETTASLVDAQAYVAPIDIDVAARVQWVSEKLFPISAHAAAAKQQQKQSDAASGQTSVAADQKHSGQAADMKTVLDRQHSRPATRTRAGSITDDAASSDHSTHDHGEHDSDLHPAATRQHPGMLSRPESASGATHHPLPPTSVAASSSALALSPANVIHELGGRGILRCIAKPCTLLFSFTWQEDIDSGLARRGLKLDPNELLRDEDTSAGADAKSAQPPPAGGNTTANSGAAGPASQPAAGARAYQASATQPSSRVSGGASGSTLLLPVRALKSWVKLYIPSVSMALDSTQFHTLTNVVHSLFLKKKPTPEETDAAKFKSAAGSGGAPIECDQSCGSLGSVRCQTCKMSLCESCDGEFHPPGTTAHLHSRVPIVQPVLARKATLSASGTGSDKKLGAAAGAAGPGGDQPSASQLPTDVHALSELIDSLLGPDSVISPTVRTVQYFVGHYAWQMRAKDGAVFLLSELGDLHGMHQFRDDESLHTSFTIRHLYMKNPNFSVQADTANTTSGGSGDNTTATGGGTLTVSSRDSLIISGSSAEGGVPPSPHPLPPTPSGLPAPHLSHPPSLHRPHSVALDTAALAERARLMVEKSSLAVADGVPSVDAASSAAAAAAGSGTAWIAPSDILVPHPIRWHERDEKRDFMVSVSAFGCAPLGKRDGRFTHVTVYKQFEVAIFPLVIQLPHHSYEMIRDYFFPKLSADHKRSRTPVKAEEFLGGNRKTKSGGDPATPQTFTQKVSGWVAKKKAQHAASVAAAADDDSDVAPAHAHGAGAGAGAASNSTNTTSGGGGSSGATDMEPGDMEDEIDTDELSPSNAAVEVPKTNFFKYFRFGSVEFRVSYVGGIVDLKDMKFKVETINYHKQMFSWDELFADLEKKMSRDLLKQSTQIVSASIAGGSRSSSVNRDKQETAITTARRLKGMFSKIKSKPKPTAGGTTGGGGAGLSQIDEKSGARGATVSQTAASKNKNRTQLDAAKSALLFGKKGDNIREKGHKLLGKQFEDDLDTVEDDDDAAVSAQTVAALAAAATNVSGRPHVAPPAAASAPFSTSMMVATVGAPLQRSNSDGDGGDENVNYNSMPVSQFYVPTIAVPDTATVIAPPLSAGTPLGSARSVGAGHSGGGPASLLFPPTPTLADHHLVSTVAGRLAPPSPTPTPHPNLMHTPSGTPIALPSSARAPLHRRISSEASNDSGAGGGDDAIDLNRDTEMLKLLGVASTPPPPPPPAAKK